MGEPKLPDVKIDRRLLFDGSESHARNSLAGEQSPLDPPPAPHVIPRFQITPKRIMEYGPTDGCQACADLAGTHTQECRVRMWGKLLEAGKVQASVALEPDSKGSSSSGGTDPAVLFGEYDGEDTGETSDALLRRVFDIELDENDEPDPALVPDTKPNKSASAKLAAILVEQIPKQNKNENTNFKTRRPVVRVSYNSWLAEGSLSGGDSPKVLDGSSTVELSSTDIAQTQGSLAASAQVEADNEPGDSTPSKAPAAPPDVGCTVPPVFKPSDSKRGRGIIFDMEDYCRDAVALYKRITGFESLRKATNLSCQRVPF